ncbi:MAG TPA: S9 family peptidase [Acidobacteriota bacterium]|nr:S9 family peptidase [Acidobacteriota bacterium]
MRKTLFTLLVGLLAATGAAAQDTGTTQEPRPMTVDDALDLVNVGNGVMSPDGEWVLYTERTLTWDDNKYETKAYMVPSSGGEVFQYVGEGGGSDFKFSPDGEYLTFKRSVGGKGSAASASGGGGPSAGGPGGPSATQQIFFMRTRGGEAVALTEHPTSIGTYLWSHDSKRIFFVADDERAEDDRKEMEKGDDAIFVDEGPNGQNRGQWSNLWAFDLESREEEQLTEERFLISSFDPSPDGKWAALSARYFNRRNDADKTELFLLDLTSGDKTRLTENQAPEGGVLWAPNSSQFLYGAADDSAWMNRNTKLWLMDAELAEHRKISGSFDGEIRSPSWTPDGRYVLFAGTEGTRWNVFRLDVESGDVEAITNLDGVVGGLSFSADRTRFVYGYTDFDSPTDLFVGTVENFEPLQITDANPQLADMSLTDMRLVQWESHDGVEIEGILHLPPGHVDGTAVPLMLNIHGGPAGVFSNSFRAMYHIYGGLGWASLSPNVRGSCCYDDYLREGNTFARGDGIGFGDFQDLMTGVDALIEQGIADPERMGVRGWSYGGILGGWTITHTDRFKAASIGAGVYDWTSEYGPGFNNDVRLWHIGGTPWDNPEAWRNQSALTHATNVTTPTLLIHGMNDLTDTEQQSMMFFTALKDIGRAPVRYLRFPREPHGFREPRHQRRRDAEEIRWMQEHVLGQEWSPAERPTEDAPAATDAADGGEDEEGSRP